jgi:cAMP phosphodiesterase
MNEFWEAVNKEESLDAILIECAFPNELEGLARDSHHLTPKSLQKEITRLQNKICPVYIINMKPMYRDEIVSQIADLRIENLQILEVGRIYDW